MFVFFQSPFPLLIPLFWHFCFRLIVFPSSCLVTFLSCLALYHNEIAFNKALGRIWHLPSLSHTGIVYWTVYTTLSTGALLLCFLQLLSLSILVCAIFRHSTSYFFCGLCRQKCYDHQYRVCAIQLFISSTALMEKKIRRLCITYTKLFTVRSLC